METVSREDYEKILQLVGGIVLTSQDAERCLKVVVPFLDLGDATSTNQFAKLEKFKKRMLGQLVGDLVGAATSDSLEFAQYMAWLVNSRNQVVHHFAENYGEKILAGRTNEVISALTVLQDRLHNFRSLSEQLALAVFEGLRDVTFQNTPQYEQMAQLCNSYRSTLHADNSCKPSMKPG